MSLQENPADRAVAVYVVVDKRTMEVVYHNHKYFALDVPYIPSFLAFREIAPLELLVRRQRQRNPSKAISISVDGNGIFYLHLPP